MDGCATAVLGITSTHDADPTIRIPINHMVHQPVVAVVNTNPDLVELLKARIEAAGFVVLVLHVADIRAGLDLGSIVAQHDPAVIVYDVVLPYERNWRFLEHLRETTLNGRRFVITTPNEHAIRKLVGKDDQVYEVLDDGGDIDAIVQAVREAARARPTR
jgi:DNA-binding NarL/FixJ family response regulator